MLTRKLSKKQELGSKGKARVWMRHLGQAPQGPRAFIFLFFSGDNNTYLGGLSMGLDKMRTKKPVASLLHK